MEDKALTTRVILVRHGESTYNIQARVQGHCDESVLTEKGRVGARQVATALSGLHFDAIYTSPLQRAGETAQIIFSALQATAASETLREPQVVNNLKEIGLPLWEGLSFEEVRQKFPTDYRYWKEQPHLLQMEVPGAKGPVLLMPVPALYEQARQLWQQILPRHWGETILLVGHSGINRALIGTALNLMPEHYHTLHQSNCGISVLNFPQGWGQPAQLESLNLTAHLGEALPPPKSGYQGLRLLLVRHGETEWNRQGRFQGGIDVPLNETGQQQARKVADFLKPVQLDAAFSSSMSRPKQTAERILEYHPTVPLTLLDGLREISHGSWEGKLEAEIEHHYPGELHRWREHPAEVQMPQGENLHQVWERAIATWNELVQSSKAAATGSQVGLVVAHDATNKVILCHVAGVGPEQFWSFKQGNGAVSIIDYPTGDGPPLLQAMNITTHLGGGVLDRTAAGAL
ncbi:MAG TPA: histidine phosphatase family protein [Candidatus Caenarcaniphilales bacterium]